MVTVSVEPCCCLPVKVLHIQHCFILLGHMLAASPIGCPANILSLMCMAMRAMLAWHRCPGMLPSCPAGRHADDQPRDEPYRQPGPAAAAAVRGGARGARSRGGWRAAAGHRCGAGCGALRHVCGAGAPSWGSVQGGLQDAALAWARHCFCIAILTRRQLACSTYTATKPKVERAGPTHVPAGAGALIK